MQSDCSVSFAIKTYTGFVNKEPNTLIHLHAQREQGKVIGVGVHIYIYMFICLWMKKI